MLIIRSCRLDIPPTNMHIYREKSNKLCVKPGYNFVMTTAGQHFLSIFTILHVTAHICIVLKFNYFRTNFNDNHNDEQSFDEQSRSSGGSRNLCLGELMGLVFLFGG